MRWNDRFGQNPKEGMPGRRHNTPKPTTVDIRSNAAERSGGVERGITLLRICDDDQTTDIARATIHCRETERGKRDGNTPDQGDHCHLFRPLPRRRVSEAQKRHDDLMETRADARRQNSSNTQKCDVQIY
ncbi:hypothetical protein PISL3812_09956 [Talaromyces islandicus]|uniref:Uncharacterized protein n=1 Tax=Talaromyces islandicus TaxID=28573 RepID=A0A0U1MCN9_TALIS|nr:hypothetical protein PISL3812_09956 [Talaromyces islandicus]